MPITTGKTKKDDDIHMLYGYTGTHYGSIRIKISRNPIGDGNYYEYGFMPNSKEYINFTKNGATPDKKLMEFMLGFAGRYEEVLTANSTNKLQNKELESIITNDLSTNFTSGQRTKTPTGHVSLNYDNNVYYINDDDKHGVKFKERKKKIITKIKWVSAHFIFFVFATVVGILKTY